MVSQVGFGNAHFLGRKLLFNFTSVMLLALASAKRCSSLHLLTLKEGYSEVSESRIRFQPLGLEKQSSLSHSAKPIDIETFPGNALLDPVKCVQMYISKTKELRKTESFF